MIVVSASGPTYADGHYWFKFQTRYGRGWAAADVGYLEEEPSPGNKIANPTANDNLNDIFPNREATDISRVTIGSSVRVRVETNNQTTTEGVRYESDTLNYGVGQRFFAGIIHQVKGSAPNILDYVRTTAYYTDGTRIDSSPVLVHLTSDWKHLITQTVTTDPNKTVNKVSLRATVEDPTDMVFYVDNVWVIEL